MYANSCDELIFTQAKCLFIRSREFSPAFQPVRDMDYLRTGNYVILFFCLPILCGMRRFRLFSDLNLLLRPLCRVFDLLYSGNIRPNRTHFWVEDPSRGRSFTQPVATFEGDHLLINTPNPSLW